MIISHKHKYLFIALPHTGSTAISDELCRNYDGEPILKKHSLYHEFQRTVKHEKEYFVFSCIRNPLDEIVSIYLKYRTNQFVGSSRAVLKRYHFVANDNNSFRDYLKKFYKLPYDNWSCLSHGQFDYIIRFERLQTDFRTVLERIGLQQKNPLPVANVTNTKTHYLTYYTPEIQDYAKYVFGPFMARWNYSFPAEWGDRPAPLSAEILFAVLRVPRRMYWRNFHNSSSMPAKLVRAVVGR